MRHAVPALLVAMLVAIALVAQVHASYAVKGINTTVYLNRNASAYVKEAINITVSNSSFVQYTIDRSSVNLNISAWQNLIGSKQISPTIINPKAGIYGFNLLPGPLAKNGSAGTADIYLTYYVSNITTANQIAPRKIMYTFNSSFWNFNVGASGAILNPNDTLNIVLINNSKVISVYPLPDSTYAIGNRSISLSWYNAEPLYNFKLVFDVQLTLTQEITGFFSAVYSQLGIFSYIIIAVAIAAILLYTYMKARA